MCPCLPILFAALTCGTPMLAAGEAPPPGGGDRPRNERGERGDSDEWRKRMVERHPELKDVDLSTPEGQEKMRQVMQTRMRERMAERQAERKTELKQELGFSDEDFTAIEPLLQRVENLRLQRTMIDRAAGPGAMFGGRGGRGGPQGSPAQPGGPGTGAPPPVGGQPPAGQGGPPRGGPPGQGFFSPEGLLGNTPIDPSVAEISEAAKALKALVGDAQANTTELELALTRLRKARAAYQEALTKAQDELRAVLTRRQEAQLVDRGTLE